MKHTLAWSMKLVLSVAVICSFIVPGAVRSVEAAEPIRIGVVLSISGWAGFIGSPQKEAMVAAVEEFNRKGGVGGTPVELYIEDDQSSPTKAVIATTKLVRDVKVAVLMGPSITDSGMAMIPIVEQEEVPFAVSGPVISPYKKWVFHVTPNDIINSSVVLEFAVNGFGAKRIAVLHDSANFGMTGMKVFNDEISKYPGASIVIREKFEVTDTNVIPQLSKIKAANPDVILLQSPGGPAAIVAKGCKQLGVKAPVVGPPSIGTPEFMNLAGSTAEELKWVLMADRLSVAEKLPLNDPYRKNIYEPFKKLLKGKYGETKTLHVFHVIGYDAMNIVTLALKTAGSGDRAAIRSALEKVKYDGMLGLFAGAPDDHRGYTKASNVPVMIQNGEFVPYKK